jgi:hypothetical protein
MDLLLLEPVGGVAGDMFLAAAVDLGVPPADIEGALRTLGVPGWRLEVTRKTEHGIQGTHLDVVVEGEPPRERRLRDILALVAASGLSPRAKEAARRVFETIGRAEAKLHGVPLEEVHFHEVGAVDSIVDGCGAAVALELLGWPRVISLPPELGRGLVKTAHGILPVPTPATLEILAGRPVRSGGANGEMVTPTGAGILAALCEVGAFPAVYTPTRIGHGVGTRSWPDRPNVLRATLARVEEAPLTPPSPRLRGERVMPGPDASSVGGGELWVLECNLDDCEGRLVARAIEAALEAGALDVWAAPVTMKKGRPGVLLGALCEEARRAAVTRALLSETTTLGVRRHAILRDALEREHVEVQTAYGPVRVKVGRLGGEVLGAQPEWDDCAARARERGVPVKEVLAAAVAAFRSRS